MSYSSVRRSEKRTPYVVELVADTDEDVATLLTHYAPGSTCFVIESSTTYMLNGSKEWVAIEIGSSSSSSSGETVDATLATEEDIDEMFEENNTNTVTVGLASTEDIDALFE